METFRYIIHYKSWMDGSEQEYPLNVGAMTEGEADKVAKSQCDSINKAYKRAGAHWHRRGSKSSRQ